MTRTSILSSVAAVALLAGGGQAVAADLPPAPDAGVIAPAPPALGNWYVRGDVGLGIFDGQGSDEAFTGGIGIGYRWSDLLRTDVTVDYTGEYDLSGGVDAEAYTVLANAYVDFNLGPAWFKPYIGAGIGYGDVEFSGRSDDDGFAYAGYAGLSFDVSPRTELDVGYRYRSISIGGPDFEDHAIRAGVRWGF